MGWTHEDLQRGLASAAKLWTHPIERRRRRAWFCVCVTLAIWCPRLNDIILSHLHNWATPTDAVSPVRLLVAKVIKKSNECEERRRTSDYFFPWAWTFVIHIHSENTVKILIPASINSQWPKLMKQWKGGFKTEWAGCHVTTNSRLSVLCTRL